MRTRLTLLKVAVLTLLLLPVVSGCQVQLGDIIIGCEDPRASDSAPPLVDAEPPVSNDLAAAASADPLTPDEVLERYYLAYLDWDFEGMLPYSTAEHQVEILQASVFIRDQAEGSEITNYPVDYTIESISYPVEGEALADTINFMYDGSVQRYQVLLVYTDEEWLVSSSF